MAFISGAAPRSPGWVGVGVFGAQWVSCKRVSFWRQIGSRLIQSVGGNNSGFRSNKDYKRASETCFPAVQEWGGFK